MRINGSNYASYLSGSTSYSTPKTNINAASTSKTELAAVYEKSSGDFVEESFLYSPIQIASVSQQSTAAAEATNPDAVYLDWINSMNAATDQYTDDVNRIIDQDRDGVFNQDILRLFQQHLSWLDEQEARLRLSLYEATGIRPEDQDLPENPTAAILARARKDVLEPLDVNLWNGIEQLIAINQANTLDATANYSQWNRNTSSMSNDYFQRIQESIKSLPYAISDTQLNRYLSDMESWVNDQLSGLTNSIGFASSGVKNTLTESGQAALVNLKARLTDMIRQEVYQKNNPPKPPAPDSLFQSGRQKFEFTVGEHKGSLTVGTSSRQSDKSSFYVVDAKGNRKKVTITFDNADLQSLFDKFFEKSVGSGQKTVSLEKLNKLLDKIKNSVKAISDTDMERLKSKLFGKEEAEYLDQHMRDFFTVLKRTLIK